MRLRGAIRLRVLRRRFLGWGRGVYVVGMHRSGTSAVTRTVNLMGVPLGDPRDLIEVMASNPTGHWESTALAGMNDRILARLGGTWSAPPPLAAGWERRRDVAELRGEARILFAATYATREWIWKDPRICLTLPFWRAHLPARAVGILVIRNPLEIARSLQARDGFDVRYGVALWERYMHCALAGLVDLPVLVTTYHDLVMDADRWCTSVSGFLSRHGFEVAMPDSARLDAFVDPGLRHSALDLDSLTGHPEVTDPQRELFRILRTLAGCHEPMTRTKLPPETAGTEALLASHRSRVENTSDRRHRPAV